MARGSRPSAPARPEQRQAGPSAVKQRRIERQKAREAANKQRRASGEPTPWQAAEAEREKRHRQAVASGSWQPVQRTELGFIVRPGRGGGIRLEDPGRKVREKYLELSRKSG